jgi:hypothetical protein
VREILRKEGVQWTSLECWYRSVGLRKGECKAVVLIGVDEVVMDEAV